MPSPRFGIHALLDNLWPVAGRRIGLITNQSGVTAAGVPTWKALRAAPNVRLVRLFGPEHGLEGGAIYMEAVSSAIHKPTGLPVVSLYGATADKMGRVDLTVTVAGSTATVEFVTSEVLDVTTGGRPRRMHLERCE